MTCRALSLANAALKAVAKSAASGICGSDLGKTGCPSYGTMLTAVPRSSYRSPEDTPDVSPTSWLWDEPDEHCVSQDSAPHEAISTVRTIRPLPPRKNFVTSDGVIARPLALQRKRRLSDAEVQPLPKRPRGCGAVARGQTVSNPLPRRGNELEEQTHNIDDWFTTFAVVEPATFEPPERRASMVIEVFTGFRGSTTRVYNKPVTSQSAAVDSSSTECSQQSAISAITPRASISMACGADGAVSSTSTNAVDVEPSHTQEEAISAHPSQDPTPLSATPSTTSFLLDGPVPPKLEMCDSPVTAAVSLTSDVSDLARSLSGISHEIVHRPDELSSNSVISQSVAPVSRDRSPTPPPSFESATTSPACDPPGYSVLDLFPPTGSLTPPPPYRHSPEKELPLILPINDKPLDAGALLAELLPLVLSGTVREYPEASPQHVQVPWAGLAISV
ncbi:uncharacterized protein B0H18DRAFT_1076366 [Fomitopsis serialis]|uniref:uncharacterized protein n=1 Tax=Fomitopsis serialis TaxID=139415 RepID=UPI0020071DFE|nr:uncharacterized protein B0H18DRAFT_1076366 [Neoantrodia serialis]KAH9908232.1 hypothetical protein B0H18DRAFT_1076366 [Neoantrodia serialis]